MSNLSPSAPVDRSHAEAKEAIATIDSTRLMKGERELLIRHGASLYRLRVTASDKLILTK